MSSLPINHREVGLRPAIRIQLDDWFIGSKADKPMIYFDANGGTGSLGPTRYNSTRDIDMPECPFEAPEGKVFEAWQIGDTVVKAGQSYYLYDDVTAKALWRDDAPQEQSMYVQGTTGNTPYYFVKDESATLAAGQLAEYKAYGASFTNTEALYFYVNGKQLNAMLDLYAEGPGQTYKNNAYYPAPASIAILNTVENATVTLKAWENGKYSFFVEGGPVVDTIPTTTHIVFSNNKGWSKVYCYAWDSSNSDQRNAAWPGVAMTYQGQNEYGEGIYSIDLNLEAFDSMIFNNGSGDQTIDIGIQKVASMGYYLTNQSGGKWFVDMYTV